MVTRDCLSLGLKRNKDVEMAYPNGLCRAKDELGEVRKGFGHEGEEEMGGGGGGVKKRGQRKEKKQKFFLETAAQ